jgi:hypothetical protein
VLDWIRLGDNWSWQVCSVDEYRVLAEPFARQALAEGRNTLYIRFAPMSHTQAAARADHSSLGSCLRF